MKSEKISVEIDRIKTRFEVWKLAADRIALIAPYRASNFKLLEKQGMLAVEAAFLINEKYKRDKFANPNHGSDPTKVAAFLTFAICQCKPFQPGKPIDPNKEAYAYANPMLAYRLGCNLVQHPTRSSDNPDYLRRHFNNFNGSRLSAIDKFIEDFNSGYRAIGSPFEIHISKEEYVLIRNRISYFETLRQMKIWK